MSKRQRRARFPSEHVELLREKKNARNLEKRESLEAGPKEATTRIIPVGGTQA